MGITLKLHRDEIEILMICYSNAIVLLILLIVFSGRRCLLYLVDAVAAIELSLSLPLQPIPKSQRMLGPPYLTLIGPPPPPEGRWRVWGRLRKTAKYELGGFGFRVYMKQN